MTKMNLSLRNMKGEIKSKLNSESMALRVVMVGIILGTVTHCLVGVNQKRDQDALCNEMKKDSKEEREAEPGLLELKGGGVLESIVNN